MGRMCEVSRDITVTSGNYKYFLKEAFTISTNRSFLLTEICKDGKDSITETWIVNGTVSLTLPVSCTLYIKFLKCSHMTVVGTDDEDVELSPATMAFAESEETLVEKLKVGDDEWNWWQQCAGG